jgi:ribosome-associated translation inhibitor RaiA
MPRCAADGADGRVRGLIEINGGLPQSSYYVTPQSMWCGMDSLRISFRNLDPSPSAEEQVRRRVAELAEDDGRITSCRVVMELGRHGHDPGSLFRVHLDVMLPGGEILVTEAREDLHAAIRDSFDLARRRLHDQARRQAAR